MCDLCEKGSVFDWRSDMVSVLDDKCISDHLRVAASLDKLVNSLTRRKP